MDLFKSRAHILEPVERSPGVTFSPRFLALYSPPQSEKIHYLSDSDGQLSLLDFDVEVADEPPDPDDFDCISAFWTACDAWESSADEGECLGFSSTLVEAAPALTGKIFPLVEAAPALTGKIFPLVDAALALTGKIFPLVDAALALTGKIFPLAEAIEATEDIKRCPCGAMPAAQCDGTTATHIYPDRVVFTPCYRNLDGFRRELVGDRVRDRSPPGGDAVP